MMPGMDDLARETIRMLASATSRGRTPRGLSPRLADDPATAKDPTGS